MDPDMLNMATNMMAKMTPEQRAQMQEQAAKMDPAYMQQMMGMLQNMTPEQKRSMQETMANAPANAFSADTTAKLSAHQKYQYDASMQLKTEGNRLHGLKNFKEAAEKYERAVSNLSGHENPESKTLRTSCQSNLASCSLQLQQWDACVYHCDAVLRSDSSNRKALYRRGQARAALGQHDVAITDLQRALDLSPESEKAVIKEKLEETKQKQAHAGQGVTIEEVHEGDEEVAEVIPAQSQTAPAPAAAVDAAANVPAPAPPSMPPADVAKAAEVMRQHPDMVRQAAEAMSSMSDAELTAHLAAGGGGALPPGATPQMARAAASMMKNMSPEDLSNMAAQATAASVGGGGTMPSSIADPAAAAEALRKDPSAFKSAAKMLENMSPADLEAMTSAMPGAVPGMKIDAEQMKMAAKMMENMSPEDFDRMTSLAQSMAPGGFPGSMPGMASSASSGAATVAPTSGHVGDSSSDIATNTSAPTASVPGAAPRFDPGNLPPDMMANMRKSMQDPDMLRSMQSMLKGMDPQTLASMMQASGMNMSPEQAQKMVDGMGGVSDRQLEWIAKVLRVINVIIELYQKMRAWAASNGAMAVALALLFVALILRWLGWI